MHAQEALMVVLPTVHMGAEMHAADRVKGHAMGHAIARAQVAAKGFLDMRIRCKEISQ